MASRGAPTVFAPMNSFAVIPTANKLQHVPDGERGDAGAGLAGVIVRSLCCADTIARAVSSAVFTQRGAASQKQLGKTTADPVRTCAQSDLISSDLCGRLRVPSPPPQARRCSCSRAVLYHQTASVWDLMKGPIHPDSRPKVVWDAVVAIFVVYVSFMVGPVRAFLNYSFIDDMPHVRAGAIPIGLPGAAISADRLNPHRRRLHAGRLAVLPHK